MELVNYLNGDTLINYKSTISPKSTFLLTPKVSENMSDWPMSDSPIILLWAKCWSGDQKKIPTRFTEAQKHCFVFEF